jgi:hypothetical protein
VVPYNILKPLAKGAIGDVDLAQDTKLKREFNFLIHVFGTLRSMEAKALYHGQ